MILVWKDKLSADPVTEVWCVEHNITTFIGTLYYFDTLEYYSQQEPTLEVAEFVVAKMEERSR